MYICYNKNKNNFIMFYKKIKNKLKLQKKKTAVYKLYLDFLFITQEPPETSTIVAIKSTIDTKALDELAASIFNKIQKAGREIKNT